MFELTLGINIGHQKYLTKFQKTIKKDLGENSVLVRHNSGQRSYLALAVSDNKKEFLKAKVLELVVFIIENEYKCTFFKERLECLGSGILSKPFLKAISIFDQESDKEIIKLQISLCGEFLIDSFYYFKCQMLKLKWEKTAQIIAQNQIMSNNFSMLEILKYLTDASESNVVTLKVSVLKDNIKISSYLGNKNFSTTSDGISNFLTEIVSLNPQKINLFKFVDDEEHNETINMLKEIFSEKIYEQN